MFDIQCRIDSPEAAQKAALLATVAGAILAGQTVTIGEPGETAAVAAPATRTRTTRAPKSGDTPAPAATEPAPAPAAAAADPADPAAMYQAITGTTLTEAPQPQPETVSVSTPAAEQVQTAPADPEAHRAALIDRARALGQERGILWVREVIEQHKVKRLSDLPTPVLESLVAAS